MDELFTQINNCIGLKEPLVYKTRKAGTINTAILICMLHSPVLSREIGAYYYPELSTTFKQQLMRLEKKGFVAARDVVRKNKKTQVDGRTKTVYVLTKQGYDEVVDLLINPPVFYDIKTDTYIMHYYAQAHIFFSFLKYGNHIYGYHLEKQLGRFARPGVQANDLYCDAVCYTRKESIFFEQDMGTEKVSQLIEKFERYNKFSDSLLDKDRTPYLIMLFKEPFIDFRSNPCFNIKVLREISEVLEHLSLREYYKTLKNKTDLSETNLKHLATIEDLFAKFKRDMSAAELIEYADGIEDFKGREYYEAYNNYQYRFAYKKRKELLEEYYRNYMTYFNESEDTEPLYTSFKFFKENLQCFLWTSTNFRNFLDFFYNEERKVEVLITKYFGNCKRLGYWSFDEKSMNYITNGNKVDRPDRGLRISLCNAYGTDCCYVCVEFPTINLGSFLRILHFRQMVRQFSCRMSIYLGVNSIEEAKWLCEILKLDEIPSFGKNVYNARNLNFFFFNLSNFNNENARLYTISSGNKLFIDGIDAK